MRQPVPDPKVIHIGQDPSPVWNDVRQWLADHYNNAEVMEALKAEDDTLDATFLDLLERWHEEARHTYGPDVDCCFEIGVDEKVGTVRLRLARRDIKPTIDIGRFIGALLEAGVSPGIIQLAQEHSTVDGKQGKPFPRFDRVKDDRDRQAPRSKLSVVK